MKKLLMLVLAIAVVPGCKGEKGDPGECDCADQLERISALETQVQSMSQEHETKIAALETATQENETEIAALDTQVQTLSAQNQDQTAKITVLETKVQDLEAKNEEVLYAFDGDGRVLGRVIDLELDSVVFFYRDPNIDLELPVEVILRPHGCFLCDNQVDSKHTPRIYYGDENCSPPQDFFDLVSEKTSDNVALLDERNGHIYRLVPGPPSSITNKSWQLIYDDSEPPANRCNTQSVSGNFNQYREIRTIDPFTPGVYVAPLP